VRCAPVLEAISGAEAALPLSMRGELPAERRSSSKAQVGGSARTASVAFALRRVGSHSRVSWLIPAAALVLFLITHWPLRFGWPEPSYLLSLAAAVVAALLGAPAWGVVMALVGVGLAVGTVLNRPNDDFNLRRD
jgi:hypothetical protein